MINYILDDSAIRPVILFYTIVFMLIVSFPPPPLLGHFTQAIGQYIPFTINISQSITCLHDLTCVAVHPRAAQRLLLYAARGKAVMPQLVRQLRLPEQTPGAMRWLFFNDSRVFESFVRLMQVSFIAVGQTLPFRV